MNVHQLERIASSVLGGALLAYSFRRRPLGRAALAVAGGDLLYRGISGHSFLYQALGMNTADGRRGRVPGAPVDAQEVERSITVERSSDDLYRFWRDPRNLSRIMGHFAEVTATSGDRAHWVVRTPIGRTMEWDTQVVEDYPGAFVRWESLAGAELPNEGAVRFRSAPGDWGTEMALYFRFVPPGGVVGEKAAKVLSIVPTLLTDKALRRCKSLVETGEIPTTRHQPAARKGGRDD